MNAHDLLWGTLSLPPEAPEWARPAAQGAQPVVVRRAPAPAGMIAVGVRGQGRAQRYGALMALHSVQRRVTPEALITQVPDPRWPALRALNELQPRLLGWTWGVTGSAGFELASAVPALHAESDLDLIVRAPRALSRTLARELLGLLEVKHCRVDVQLQTPLGGVALGDWASDASRVLLKTQTAAVLVSDPWQGAA